MHDTAGWSTVGEAMGSSQLIMTGTIVSSDVGNLKSA